MTGPPWNYFFVGSGMEGLGEAQLIELFQDYCIELVCVESRVLTSSFAFVNSLHRLLNLHEMD